VQKYYLNRHLQRKNSNIFALILKTIHVQLSNQLSNVAITEHAFCNESDHLSTQVIALTDFRDLYVPALLTIE